MSQRKASAHKGDFGHVFILAGCLEFSGAAVLCAEAAARCGAGQVTLGLPTGINSAVIKIKPKEVMTLPLPQTKDGSLGLSGDKRIKDFIKNIDVVVVGPGLSQNKSTQELARKIIAESDKSIVIDADGLNALAGHLEVLRTTPRLGASPLARGERTTILTPHPGEMARLLGVNVKHVQADRIGIAQRFAKFHKTTLVLKGHDTVVADPRGNLYINKTGNPGMAKAGSGDVLAGMIAAFLGQGLDGFEAAKYAVYLHGLAGDLAAREKTQMGMVATDIIAEIPEAVKKSR